MVGGKVEFGESIEMGLLREIREEVGLKVTLERILYAITFFTDPTRQIVLLSYLCTSETANITLSDEHSNYRWATKKTIDGF